VKYVVDTCIINKLIDGLMDAAELPTDGEFIATHVQIDELNRTKDQERRAKLSLMFAKLRSEVWETESFVLGTSRLDEAKLGEAITFQSIKDALDARKKKPNNVQDALIAEVAISNNFTLLTSDKDLATVVQSLGAKVRYWPI
jgi:predicted nucleic acid-binding protein